MGGILGQISVAIGGLLFIAALALALSQGVPLVEAVFRAAVVMCVSSAIIALFFRFFASVLYRFVAEQILLQRQAKVAKAAEAKAKQGPPL